MYILYNVYYVCKVRHSFLKRLALAHLFSSLAHKIAFIENESYSLGKIFISKELVYSMDYRRFYTIKCGKVYKLYTFPHLIV